MSLGRVEQRAKRHRRIRKKVKGTGVRPRLCVSRSLSNIQAQIIDDATGTTLVSVTTLDKGFADYQGNKGNVKAAKRAGQLIGERAKAKGINAVVFDRGGYLYHGRIKAVADGAREAGLEF